MITFTHLDTIESDLGLLSSRDVIETPDETIVLIHLEVFLINYLSSYAHPSIFKISIVPTLFLPTKSCPISINIVKIISIIWHLILDILSWVNISLGHDLHLEEAEVLTDSELKEEAYDNDDSDI